VNSNIAGKIVFAGMLGFVGYLLGFWQGHSLKNSLIGASWGFTLAALILFLEFLLCKVSSRALLGAILGGVIGLVFSQFFIQAFLPGAPEANGMFFYVQRSMSVLLVITGAMIGTKRLQQVELNFSRPPSVSEHTPARNYKILDTSVIIDGRIADLSETGFLEGILIIPQFILQELQHIADSADSIKRNRGRRGLEILHKIQKRVDIQVEIIEQDFPKIPEIDAKLVELAKEIRAKLITNDFNLNKVAELQGVSVLNVNELANALKPVVLPGEEIEVQVLKEGKEYDQGIAYLDDGTMIVIDHAKKLIGKTVGVSVTSVLQTTAGRMIFGQLASKPPGK
jgi:uncharacterized protein YacL